MVVGAWVLMQVQQVMQASNESPFSATSALPEVKVESEHASANTRGRILHEGYPQRDSQS